MNIIPLSQEIRLLVNFVVATEFPSDRIFPVTPSSINHVTVFTALYL